MRFLGRSSIAFFPGGTPEPPGLLQGGLIDYAPSASFPSGDNPAYKEYHWHGLQLIAGNGDRRKVAEDGARVVRALDRLTVSLSG